MLSPQPPLRGSGPSRSTLIFDCGDRGLWPDCNFETGCNGARLHSAVHFYLGRWCQRVRACGNNDVDIQAFTVLVGMLRLMTHARGLGLLLSIPRII